MPVDPLSLSSIYLECWGLPGRLGVATGFTIRLGGRNYLVTNQHVVAGIDPDTGALLDPTGAVPYELRVGMHKAEDFGSWIEVRLAVRDVQSTPLWLSHPNPKVDVVLVDLDPLPPGATAYPLAWALASVDMTATPAMPVSIIGFPLGMPSVGLLPIWKTGHIASEPDIDVGEVPVFLIDATTRSGMSGSPVVLRLSGGFATKSGEFWMAGEPRTRFLGVYSGRIHKDVEVGKVWRPSTIEEILAAHGRPTAP